MSNFPVVPDTGCIATSKCDPMPISQHRAESDFNLPKRNARNTDIAASDWRDEAIARGRTAYESAVAEPETTADPLAWLWRHR
jgi:hypothetical protein